MIRRRRSCDCDSGTTIRYAARRAGIALAAALMLAVLPACQSHRATAPRISALTTEPIIRVRVVAGQPNVRITGPAIVSIGPTPDRTTTVRPRNFHTPLTVRLDAGRFILRPDRGQALAWAIPELHVQSLESQTVQVNGTVYPGALWLHRHVNKQGQPTGRIDAVNHVPLETYLPGVLERELYSQWQPQAFAAQAIAARSYAIATAAQHRDRHYDLEATIASQMYGGQATNHRAIDAVRQTRGRVLTYHGRVVFAYYSSCCGGTGQDAVIAFADGVDIPPLRGRPHGHWCTASKYYRWGPIRRDARALARRIAAWGREHEHPIARLRGLRRIAITTANAAGRPATFTVTDTVGRAYKLAAEQFRFACNQEGRGLPPLPPASQLRSSHVRVRVAGRSVFFTDGHGYGHGVGLCQHGAQALAQKGYNAPTILNHYYRGAAIKRAY
ncbi:MAG: SpoIID/LytB domain-containing protein [Phycisphaeraceae bacterium]